MCFRHNKWEENKKVYMHMAYVKYNKERLVFLGLMFKKRGGESCTGDKLAMVISDPVDVDSQSIDQNTDFISNAVVQLVRLGDCTPVYDKDSGGISFVESPI